MNIQFGKNKSIVIQKIGYSIQQKQNYHRILIVDVSGSMSSELAGLREQLKNILPTLLKEGDICSLIYFSDSNQYGTVFEGLKIESVNDISVMKNAIDKWLKPMSMTSFLQPLKLSEDII